MHCGSGSQSTVRLRSFFGRYSSKEPIHLAVDPVSEIEGIRTPIVSSDPERECPQATRVIVASVDGKRPAKPTASRVENVDLAMEKAEVADQQITAKPAETGRCQGYTPGRSKPTAVP